MVLPNKNIFKIGYKIKAFRKANNLTQEQLADKMNCNFKTDDAGSETGYQPVRRFERKHG